MTDQQQLAVRGDSQVGFSITTLQEMAKVIVESELFGGIKKESQAMTLMLLSQAKGMHPALFLEDYDIVAGRPAMKAQRMLAKFQEAGGVVEWIQRDDETCVAKFSHPRACPAPIKVEWTMKMAAKAGLANKDVWKQYPRNMLHARCVSEGVRAAYPSVISGNIYTPEEIIDFDEATPLTKMKKAQQQSGGSAPGKMEVIEGGLSKTKGVAVDPEGEVIEEAETETVTVVDTKEEGKLTLSDIEKGEKATVKKEKPPPQEEEADEIPGLEENQKPPPPEEIPEPAPTGELPKGMEFLAGHEAKAIAWLQSTGWLKEGQTLTDLQAIHRKKIIDRPAPFKAALEIP